MRGMMMQIESTGERLTELQLRNRAIRAIRDDLNRTAKRLIALGEHWAAAFVASAVEQMEDE